MQAYGAAARPDVAATCQGPAHRIDPAADALTPAGLGDHIGRLSTSSSCSSSRRGPDAIPTSPQHPRRSVSPRRHGRARGLDRDRVRGQPARSEDRVHHGGQPRRRHRRRPERRGVDPERRLGEVDDPRVLQRQRRGREQDGLALHQPGARAREPHPRPAARHGSGQRGARLRRRRHAAVELRLRGQGHQLQLRPRPQHHVGHPAPVRGRAGDAGAAADPQDPGLHPLRHHRPPGEPGERHHREPRRAGVHRQRPAGRHAAVHQRHALHEGPGRRRSARLDPHPAVGRLRRGRQRGVVLDGRVQGADPSAHRDR